MQHIKNIWPTVKELADALGVPYTTAHSWESRGRIPAAYDFDLILAAEKRGKKLTLDDLAKARVCEKVGGSGKHTTRNAYAKRQRQESIDEKARGVA